MGSVVSFLRIFEEILWLFCLSRPWGFQEFRSVLSMDWKFCGPTCVWFLICNFWFFMASETKILIHSF